MSRIYIVGIVAGGKTTLAKKLSEETRIPYYEADCIVHVKTETGRYKRTPEEQIEEINRIDSLGDWIIEGVYRPSYHCLLEKADGIIFLDPPLKVRKRRILMRFIKQNLHIEPCHYKSDLNMLKMMYKWTDEFEKNRAEFEKMLDEYKSKLTVLTNEKEIRMYMKGLGL